MTEKVGPWLAWAGPESTSIWEQTMYNCRLQRLSYQLPLGSIHTLKLRPITVRKILDVFQDHKPFPTNWTIQAESPYTDVKLAFHGKAMCQR